MESWIIGGQRWVRMLQQGCRTPRCLVMNLMTAGWLTSQGIMSPPIFVSWDQYSSNDFCMPETIAGSNMLFWNNLHFYTLCSEWKKNYAASKENNYLMKFGGKFVDRQIRWHICHLNIWWFNKLGDDYWLWWHSCHQIWWVTELRDYFGDKFSDSQILLTNFMTFFSRQICH